MTKTILITGSTDGIGKLVALKLAKNDHTIYVHGSGKYFIMIKERLHRRTGMLMIRGRLISY